MIRVLFTTYGYTFGIRIVSNRSNSPGADDARCRHCIINKIKIKVMKMMTTMIMKRVFKYRCLPYKVKNKKYVLLLDIDHKRYIQLFFIEIEVETNDSSFVIFF